MRVVGWGRSADAELYAFVAVAVAAHVYAHDHAHDYVDGKDCEGGGCGV
jgi:hypothetical protein